MAAISVEGDQLVVRLSTGEKIGAIGGDVSVARSAVTNIYTASPAMSAVSGLRIRGTGIPRVIALGTRITGSGRIFVAVHASDPGSVVVELTGTRYTQLVVSTADPEATATELRG